MQEKKDNFGIFVYYYFSALLYYCILRWEKKYSNICNRIFEPRFYLKVMQKLSETAFIEQHERAEEGHKPNLYFKPILNHLLYLIQMISLLLICAIIGPNRSVILCSLTKFGLRRA